MVINDVDSISFLVEKERNGAICISDDDQAGEFVTLSLFFLTFMQAYNESTDDRTNYNEESLEFLMDRAGKFETYKTREYDLLALNHQPASSGENSVDNAQIITENEQERNNEEKNKTPKRMKQTKLNFFKK